MADDEKDEKDEKDEGTDDAGTDDAGSGGTDDGAEAWDEARARATIKKLREHEKEGQKAKRELDATLKRLKALEDAQLSEQERQAKELEELKAKEASWATERQDMLVSLGVAELAGELGIADIDLTIRALDRDEIEFDASGVPGNLREVVSKLLDAKPLLKGKPASGGRARTNAGDGSQDGSNDSGLTADEAKAAAELGMPASRYGAMRQVRTLADYQKVREREKNASGK